MNALVQAARQGSDLAFELELREQRGSLGGRQSHARGKGVPVARIVAERSEQGAGVVVATLPLAPATASNGVTVLRAPIKGGAGDLCFTFTQKTIEPMWVVDRVTLIAGGDRGR